MDGYRVLIARVGGRCRIPGFYEQIAEERVVKSVPLPSPRPASGEVLIRVRASAVNNTDVNTRTGWYSKAVRGDTNSAAVTGYDGAADAA